MYRMEANSKGLARQSLQEQNFQRGTLSCQLQHAAFVHQQEASPLLTSFRSQAFASN